MLKSLPTHYKFLERFWSKVAKSDECWLWIGCKYKNGYGKIRVGNGKRQGAHRISWMIHFGLIPGGQSVLHKCDVPACVNPEHLFLGTQKDNLADIFMKGRDRQPDQRGALNGNSKLSFQQVLEIRASPERRATLARRYGVTFTCIHRIVTGYSWSVVPSQPLQEAPHDAIPAPSLS